MLSTFTFSRNTLMMPKVSMSLAICLGSAVFSSLSLYSLSVSCCVTSRKAHNRRRSKASFCRNPWGGPNNTGFQLAFGYPRRSVLQPSFLMGATHQGFLYESLEGLFVGFTSIYFVGFLILIQSSVRLCRGHHV